MLFWQSLREAVNCFNGEMKVETVTVTEKEKELQTVQVNVVDPCQTVRMVSRG